MGGVTLAAGRGGDPGDSRPGTVVAHDEGLVVVIDTQLTPELRAEGDARELQRAIQDARKEAGVELDDEVTDQGRRAGSPSVRSLEPFIGSVEAETGARSCSASSRRPADSHRRWTWTR